MGNEGKRGVAKLRRVLDLPGGPKRTRSRGERLKIATLIAQGLSVFPVTGRQLRDDPAGVVDRLTRALATARTLRRVSG